MLALRLTTLLAAGGVLWLASVASILALLKAAQRDDAWQADLDDDELDDAIRRILDEADQ